MVDAGRGVFGYLVAAGGWFRGRRRGVYGDRIFVRGERFMGGVGALDFGDSERAGERDVGGRFAAVMPRTVRRGRAISGDWVADFGGVGGGGARRKNCWRCRPRLPLRRF